MLKTEEIWKFEVNPEKSGKNPETGWNFGQEYHIWEVIGNHPICAEICIKPLNSEDLSSVLNKKNPKKKYLSFGASLTK